MTPPPAMVALISVSNSSSPLMASWRCLGVILFTFKSLEALPANSSTSAVRYSNMAELYTAAVAPTRPDEKERLLRWRWILKILKVKPDVINYPPLPLPTELVTNAKGKLVVESGVPSKLYYTAVAGIFDISITGHFYNRWPLCFLEKPKAEDTRGIKKIQTLISELWMDHL